MCTTTQRRDYNLNRTRQAESSPTASAGTWDGLSVSVEPLALVWVWEKLLL
jgi:hypothetical protein